MTDALAGDEITISKLLFLRLRFWLMKWDSGMFLVLGLAAIVGFLLGRISRGRQSGDGAPEFS